MKKNASSSLIVHTYTAVQTPQDPKYSHVERDCALILELQKRLPPIPILLRLARLLTLHREIGFCDNIGHFLTSDFLESVSKRTLTSSMTSNPFYFMPRPNVNVILCK